MKTGLRIVSLLLLAAICIPALGSCGSDMSAGLVKSVVPESTVGKLISTSTEFTVKTKRATDKDSLEKSIAVSPDVDFQIEGSGSSYTLKFGSSLEADKVYTFSSLCGGRTVYQWAYQTSPDFTVTKVLLPQSLDSKKISFTFSYSDVEGFAKNFAISPKVDGTFSCKNNTWTFTADEPFNPETTYTVTLKKSVSCTNGLTLSKDYTASFTTPEPSGNFASIVHDDTDYAANFLPDEAPVALIKSRGPKIKAASVSVYQFTDYKSYLNAHTTYFEAPDLSHADKLISSLKAYSSFDTELIDYPDAKFVNANQTELDKSLLIYPDVYPAGYYLSVITLGDYTLYHLFRVSSLSVYTLTCGNTLTVWVNNTKTAKPLFDSEVILDSTYDEKTDENGVVRFTLPESSKSAAYLVINDPNNSDLPYVRYVPINENYSATNVNANYNCVLYTDCGSYANGDKISIFGAALPVSGSYSADSATLEYKIGKQSYSVGITPDKNGAFNTTITAPDDEIGAMSISLKIDGVITAESSVDIEAKSTADKKTAVNDIFVSAALDSGSLTLSASNVSSTPNSNAELNLSASEKYGAAVYNIGNADVDYTISVIKHTLYEKQQNGSYYEDITRSTQPLYSYRRINKTETVQKISGNTVNGTSVRIISQQNEPQNGVYYSCKISYKNKAGKTVSVSCGDDFGYAKAYDSSAYQIAFDNTVGAGGTFGAAVKLGDKTVKSGNVLCVPAYRNAYSAQLFSADNINLKPNESYPREFFVCSAYFDGRRVYTLNRSVINQSDKNYTLGVTLTTDKTAYAKGDTVTLNVAVTDGGKAASVPVLICIKPSDTSDYLSTPEFKLPQSDVTEKVSGDYLGITRRQGFDKAAANNRANADKALYFESVTTNGSGKATFEFTANEYGKRYICQAVALSGYKSGTAAAFADCSQNAAVDLAAPVKITVNDDFIITAKAQAADNTQPTATAQSAVSDATAATENAAATGIAATEKAAADEDMQYNVTASLYSAPKSGENEFDEKQKLQTVQQTLLAGEEAQLSFGRLAAGKYNYTAEYEHLSEKRTVRGSFTVSAKDTVISPKLEAIDENGLIPDESDSTLTAIVYKSAYSPMFTLAKTLYENDTENLSKYIAKLAAARLFGTQESSASIKSYQKNGLAFTKNGNSDVYYTAAATALCADFADKDKLKAYFNEYISSDDETTSLAAYFGLAALHEPVLDKLYKFNDSADALTDRQKLYLALSCAYIGDYDTAKTLYTSLYPQTDNADSPLPETDELKSDDDMLLGCLLYLKLNDSAAKSMVEYLLSLDESEIDSKYEYLCYAQYISDYVINGDKNAALTVKTGDDAKNIKFDGYGFYKTSIKPENIDKTALISKDDLYVCLLYTVKKDG